MVRADRGPPASIWREPREIRTPTAQATQWPGDAVDRTEAGLNEVDEWTGVESRSGVNQENRLWKIEHPFHRGSYKAVVRITVVSVYGGRRLQGAPADDQRSGLGGPPHFFLRPLAAD